VQVGHGVLQDGLTAAEVRRQSEIHPIPQGRFEDGTRLANEECRAQRQHVVLDELASVGLEQATQLDDEGVVRALEGKAAVPGGHHDLAGLALGGLLVQQLQLALDDLRPLVDVIDARIRCRRQRGRRRWSVGWRRRGGHALRCRRDRYCVLGARERR
jgi:hypothetical protein